MTPYEQPILDALRAIIAQALISEAYLPGYPAEVLADDAEPIEGQQKLFVYLHDGTDETLEVPAVGPGASRVVRLTIDIELYLPREVDHPRTVLRKALAMIRAQVPETALDGVEPPPVRMGWVGRAMPPPVQGARFYLGVLTLAVDALEGAP